MTYIMQLHDNGLSYKKITKQLHFHFTYIFGLKKWYLENIKKQAASQKGKNEKNTARIFIKRVDEGTKENPQQDYQGMEGSKCGGASMDERIKKRCADV